MWECDDGNNNNNDGCDSECFIEAGWFCFGGDTNNRDICLLRPRPIITEFILSEDNSRATIRFNESIIIDQ